jgi:hypothetical protein
MPGVHLDASFRDDSLRDVSSRHYIIELPPAVGRRVVRAAKRENRKPSDVAIEALRLYFNFPTEAATAAELRAIRRGEVAYKKGDYSTLDEYFHSVGNRPRRPRKKVS